MRFLYNLAAILIVTIIMSIEYGLLEPLRRLFDVTRRQ